MKYSQWIGVLASVMLAVACFMHWTWYPDLQKYFSGFYSEGNLYGRPGKGLIFFAAIAVVFYLVPKLWAKRWNMIVCCILLGFAIRTFIVFGTCYRGICPERQFGIWLMLGSTIVMLLATLLPDLKVSDSSAPKKSGE
jgi:hypothetical protein